MNYEEKSKEDLIAELKKSNDVISQLESALSSQQNQNNDYKKQLKEVQKDLREKESKYNKIFENIQDIYYYADNNGIIKEISPSVERYSGYKPEELIGNPVTMAYNNPEDRNRMMNAIKEKGEVIDYEIQLRSKEGRVIFTSNNARLILDENDQPLGIEGYLRDITERKKSEALLFNTKNRLRLTLDLAKVGSWEYDVDSDRFTFDDQFYSIYGTTAQEQGGLQMSSKEYAARFIPPEESSIVREEIGRFKATDNPHYSNQLEHSIIRGDGEKRFIVVRNSILKDENGKTIKAFGANQDITEAKMAEKTIKMSEEKYRNIFDNVQDVFYQTNREGTITEISPSIVRYSGFSREDLIGQPVETVYLHPEEREQMLKLIQDEGEISDYELKLKNINGNIVNASVNAHFLFDSDGEIIGIEGSLRDITQRKKAEQALKESEERFRTIFENTGAATAIYNSEGILTLINTEVGNLLHYSPEDLAHKRKWMEFVYPEDLPMMLKYNEQRLKDPASAPKIYETRVLDKNGEVHHTQITVDKIPGVEEYVTSLLDITDLKNAYNHLEESETRFRSLFENNPVPYQSLDENGTYIDLNEPLSDLLGYECGEILGKKFRDFWSPQTLEQFPENLDYLDHNQGVNNLELELIDKNGSKKTVLLTGRVQKDPQTNRFIRTHDIIYDISTRKLMEEQLKKSLGEKEMLIKEIHHRVKNNLMIISSLLNLQSNLIKNKEARDVFKESQNRASSMALIHEKLYKSGDLKRIDFGEYVRNLSIDLFHAYFLDPMKVKLTIIAEREMIDIDTAIPLGLIVNELVTNSMKYAFPDDKTGEITISFHRIGDEYCLRVKDNGVGIGEEVDVDLVESLGMQLITRLTRQINGKLEFDRSEGTDFKIIFKEVDFQSKIYC